MKVAKKLQWIYQKQQIKLQREKNEAAKEEKSKKINSKPSNAIKAQEKSIQSYLSKKGTKEATNSEHKENTTQDSANQRFTRQTSKTKQLEID